MADTTTDHDHDHAPATEPENDRPAHGLRCDCGATFAKPRRFERHVFNERALDWIETNLGDPFTTYATDLIHHDSQALTPWETAAEDNDDDEPKRDPDNPYHVRQAAADYCRGALASPNLEALIDA